MKAFKNLLLLFCAISLISCGNTENNKLIIGKWKGSEWLIDGKPSERNVTETAFSFDEKGNYSYNYAGTEEKGTYKVENNMLFTKPTGQLEMMVIINKINNDSLVFDMNRSGTTETLTLLKTQ